MAQKAIKKLGEPGTTEENKGKPRHWKRHSIEWECPATGNAIPLNGNAEASHGCLQAAATGLTNWNPIQTLKTCYVVDWALRPLWSQVCQELPPKTF